ncbi:MAG: hypothetical protein PHE78_03380 [Candidatus Gastranaerophilales bacterium]|nr:hypothetical protein [Candidatus Gastranaerophilales bacterium]
MAFTYGINTGKLSSAYNSDYLKNVFGFSSDALATSNGLLSDPSKFISDYQNLYSTTLSVSDGYKFFESGNDDYMDMTKLVSSSELAYTANTVEDRVDVYKELFLEKFATGATAALNVTSGSLDLANYNFVNADGNTVAGSTILSGGKISTNMENLEALYNQLSKEATALKSELNSNILAYGGYPEIAYSSIDAETALLQKQLDAEMQTYMSLYDDLFAYYKTKAGGHSLDNESNSDDRLRREKEAATAATMAASLALQYAQETYGQSVKPEVSDYIFANADMIFGTLFNDDTSTGIDGASQEEMFYNLAANYAADGTNIRNFLLNDSSTTGYTKFNQVAANASVASAKTTEAEKAKVYMWDMSTGLNLDEQTDNPTDVDQGSKLSTFALDEIGDTVPLYISWMVRDSFGVGGLTPDVNNTGYTSENATFLTTAIMSSAQKLVDLQMKVQQKTIESSINNSIRAEYEARVGAMQALQELMIAECPNGTDPYEVVIDGQKYILGVDSNDDGTIGNVAEILGIKDTKENLFESLKNLDTNKDGYVSQEEMTAAKVILNAVDENGTLTGSGYDMSLVQGINLSSLSSADGTNNIFGTFTMDLKDKSVAGNLTFEDQDYFSKLFASKGNNSYEDIDVESSIAPIVTSKSTSKVVSEAEKVDSEVAVEEPEKQTTASTLDLKDGFSFTFSDIKEDSAIESLFEKICWQMGISNLSFTQKSNILGDIDANTDLSIAETQIRQDLESINLSA